MHNISITALQHLMSLKNITAVYSKNLASPIIAFYGRNPRFRYIKCRRFKKIKIVTHMITAEFENQ